MAALFPFLLLLLLLHVFVNPCLAGEFVAANDPSVRWFGRPYFSPNGAVSFDWEGTGCTFVVEGVGATVTLVANVTLFPQNSGRISVFVNDYDAANLMLHSSTSTYLMAAALPAASNNVTLHYSFEPGSSGANANAGRLVSILGFELGNGGSVAAVATAARRIDIIGDSITAGSMYDKLEAVGGALSLGTGCGPWSPPTGYSQAYNWESYLCRYFRANCTTIAWSGRGLIHNSGCSGGPLMPQYYTQTFGTGSMLWDFARTSRPDAVIIYLGTNDYSCSLTTDAAFTAAYVAFMQNITAWYATSPGQAGPIHFLCAIGPMSPTRPRAALLAAIAQAQAAGLTASLLDMTGNVTLDGCGSHPGPMGHWQMALLAAPQIGAALGWKS